jgi:hypothetical protein
MIHGLLDRLAERFGEGAHKLEAMRAREEYFDRAGKVFDDDAELFEGRVASFLEWYLLERPMTLGDGPPIMRALDESLQLVPGWPAEERGALAALATSHRSLFTLTGVDMVERVLELEDLVGGASFLVMERRSTIGISPGDVFEARLVWDGNAVMFGRTFLFHPPDAREAVLDWVDKAVKGGTSRDDILFHLSRQYVRWHRLGHVGAAKVYRDA